MMPRHSTISLLLLAALPLMAWPTFTPPPQPVYGYGYGQPQPPPPPPPGYGYGQYQQWGEEPPEPWPYWDREDSGHHHRHKHHHRKHGSGGGYSQIGEFSSAGVREISLGGGKSSAYIEFISGTTSINTIVIRRGGMKQSVTVSTRFTAGQRYQLQIDRSVTGVRISSSGNGRYRVYAK